MEFPLVVLPQEGGLSVFHSPAPFASPDGVQHPAAAWSCWTAEDWAEKVPGWRILPLVDLPPVAAGHRVVRRPPEAWTVGDEAVTATYDLVPLSPEEIEAQRPPVPDRVTNFQARAALLEAGLFATVDDALLALPVDSPERQAWEYANELTRYGALVNGMANQLGLTGDQLDALFRRAAEIEA